jgi:MFS-type transporter involved in bile tolerance (Atg22 family)
MGKDIKKLSFIGKLVASLDTTVYGFSLRKIAAVITIFAGIYLANKFATAENVIYLVGILLIFALLCLGIVTVDQLFRFYKESKEGKDDEPEVEQVTTQQQTTTVVDEAPLNMIAKPDQPTE